MDKRIISVLIGLVGACNNGVPTKNTDTLLIRALAFAPSSEDDPEIEKLIEEIRAEKNIVSPGCAACASPCGNTSDFDLNRLNGASEEIRNIKEEILTVLHRIAKDVEELYDKDIELLYKSLSYVSYDMEKEPLQDLLNELKKIK
ncbi:MAG: hypothetical protein K2N36_05810 [Ruminiclostridium sp.]|nr:hypothetical protein [Ruminiclostridium sp.]